MENLDEMSTRLQDYEIDVPEELKSLIPGFMGRRAKDVIEIESFLQDSNYCEIAKIGHKLKGHGESYGFKVLSVIGSRIESSAKKNNRAMLIQLLGEMTVVVDELKGKTF